jgi:hypothetical protein
MSRPVRNRVLNTLEVSGAGRALVISVSLILPVRYMRISPTGFGEELSVKLQPVAARPLGQDVLPLREVHAPAGRGEPTPLQPVLYAGDIEGGPN